MRRTKFIIVYLLFVVFCLYAQSQLFIDRNGYTVDSIYTEGISKDFLSMMGVRIIHPFADSKDSLSAKEIIELQGDGNSSIWFGRYVREIVCLTGECQIARLWLFWDEAGDYLGFQLYNNEALTKTDHKPFSLDDYRKLDFVLRDAWSAMRYITQDELISDEEEVDGYSGATQSVYIDELVEGAAYTCYTLWHTVYGETRTEIRRIVQSRNR